MSRARDSQRSKFWKADGEISSYMRFKKLETHERARFFDEVLNSAWFIKNFPTGKRTDKLARWADNEPKILRNIAFRLIKSDQAWHGREMCEIYMMLVRRFLGVNIAEELKTAFKQNRVKFRPKRKMSESQIAAAKKRLIPFKNQFVLELEKL